ncbi:primase-helicase family protein [Sansalvadorimonas verongulae]|uniref:primase-helicase family protein n=1 Tax=Sansalvadorimonas verongulae TaxID=2172824 RepID=UPI0012BD73CC|nr:primase-helicase family protein [Sansalvadorimonas verongulae]MTI12794.1 hypothetical protein [Sansalvadorimonas verongulae]
MTEVQAQPERVTVSNDFAFNYGIDTSGLDDTTKQLIASAMKTYKPDTEEPATAPEAPEVAPDEAFDEALSFTPDEVFSMYKGTGNSAGDLFEHLDELGLSDTQKNKLLSLPDKAKKNAGKVIENMVKEAQKQHDNKIAEAKKDLLNEEQRKASEAIVGWLKKNQIFYISTCKKPWVCFHCDSKTKAYERSWVAYSNDELALKFRNETRESLSDLLKVGEGTIKMTDLAIDSGLFFERITSTNSEDIAPNMFNQLAVERKYWITNGSLYKNAKPKSHKGLLILLMSLAGGKKENLKHLCEVLQWKFKVSGDVTQLPAIVIYGAEGVGKGVFFENLLPTMANGPTSSAEVKVSQLDGFNKLIEGKSFVGLNESDQDKKAGAAIKKTIGSKRIVIEPKGIDGYEVDNTASYFFFTNDPLSSINLSRNVNENRRFSIMKVEKPLEYWVMKKTDCKTVEEAKRYISEEIIPACNDRKVLAGMLKWMEQEYPVDSCPRALHGDDYLDLIEVQGTKVEEFIKSLFDNLMSKRACDGTPLGGVDYSQIVDTVREYSSSTGGSKNENFAKREVSNFVARSETLKHLVAGEKVNAIRFNGVRKRNTIYWKNGKEAAFADLMDIKRSIPSWAPEHMRVYTV